MNNDIPSEIKWSTMDKATDSNVENQLCRCRTAIEEGFQMETDDPDLPVLIAEMEQVNEYTRRLVLFLLAMPELCADEAIAQWIRFGNFLKSARIRSIEDHAFLLSQISRSRIRSNAGIPSPVQLKGNIRALSALGRWRASDLLGITAASAQLNVFAATSLIHHIKDVIVTRGAFLEAQSQLRAKDLAETRRDERGESFEVDSEFFFRIEESVVTLSAAVKRT